MKYLIGTLASLTLSLPVWESPYNHRPTSLMGIIWDRRMGFPPHLTPREARLNAKARLLLRGNRDALK